MNVFSVENEEVVAIFSKYLSKESAQSIGISDQLRNDVVNRICTKNGHVDPSCFESAQEFVMHALEKR
jgi:A-kinase anchor protein 10